MIQERMDAVKRTLASSDASTQSAPNAAANGKTNVGLYDVACDGDGWDNPDDLPKPGRIMEEVIDFLREWDGVLCNGDVAGDWAIVITPHRRDKESEEDETEDDEAEDDEAEDDETEDDETEDGEAEDGEAEDGEAEEESSESDE
jgi:hypothetical protein